MATIISTFNGEKYIEEQLVSIVNQTKKINKIYIFDDCSKDRTVEIVKRVLSHVDIQIEIIEKICPIYKVSRSKHYIRHDFFKNISTEIQAYLLGFYIADGSINEKRKTFSVEL